jgi:hypothetical protein
MQFVPAGSDQPAHLKASIEKGRSLPSGSFICLVFTHQELDLLGEETADRSLAAGRKNFRLLNHLPTETYRYVLPVFIP